MSFFSTRLDHVGTRQKEYASDPAVYTRDRTSVSVDVTPLGTRRFETAIGQVVLEESTESDFVCDTDSLGSLGLPLRGDVLKYRNRRFEVVAVGDETFTYVTNSRRRIRFHTREIKS